MYFEISTTLVLFLNIISIDNNFFAEYYINVANSTALMTSTDGKKYKKKNQRRAYDGCRMQLYALSLVTGRTAPSNITIMQSVWGKEDVTAVSQ